MWNVGHVRGLSDDGNALVAGLLKTLGEKQARNLLRRSYYDRKNTAQMLGVTIPQGMERFATVLGWPAKAVDSMARRTILDRWIGGDDIPEVQAIINENRLWSEIPMMLTAALQQSVAFVSVVMPTDENIPRITVASAEMATGSWDTHKHGLRDALFVTQCSEKPGEVGRPLELILFRRGETTVMAVDGNAWTVIDKQDLADSACVPVEAVPYRPLLGRPFGQSRINRSVMGLTDAAMRTFLRAEVAAEFYNAPQRYALGVDDATFNDMDGNLLPGWKILLGHMLVAHSDGEGQKPEVGQFPQQSMEPDAAHFRMIAQAFAAETSLPLRSLGVVGDNPESADAISEANRELELEITHWQTSVLTPALTRIMELAMKASGVSGVSVVPHWKRPDTVGLAAATDAATKQIAAVPWLADSDVVLEEMGFTAEQIQRLLDAKASAQASVAVDSLTQGL